MKKLSLTLCLFLVSLMLSGCMFLSERGDDASDDKAIAVPENTIEKLPDNEDTNNNEPEGEEIEDDLDIEENNESDPSEENISGFYAATICMVADPAFREGFMDGGSGREDGDDSDNPFLGKYGYANDAEAEADLRKYIDTSGFAETLSNQLGVMCPGAIGPDEFAEILGNLQIEYGGEGELAPEDDIIDMGECKRDEDCATICEGTVAWERGCQARDNSCVKTFDTDCATTTTSVDWFDSETYDVVNVCVPNEGCVRGSLAGPLQERKTGLQDQWKSLQGEKQQLTTLYQQAAALCLGTLSDPTGITDLLASTISLDSTSEATQAVLTEVSKAPEVTQTSTRCTLEQRLKETDLPLLENTLDGLLERVKEVDKRTDMIDDV